MPEDHRDELRLWLRLLTCSTLIEGEIRAPPARALRRHAAPLRPDGATRQGARRHDAVRPLEAHDGVERQSHRPRRPARRLRPSRPPRLRHGPARAGDQPDASRAAPSSAPMAARARGLDRRSVRRSHREGPERSHAASRQDQAVRPPRDPWETTSDAVMPMPSPCRCPATSRSISCSRSTAPSRPSPSTVRTRKTRSPSRAIAS